MNTEQTILLVASYWHGRALYESTKRNKESRARKRGFELMERAVKQAEGRLKEKYSLLYSFILEGRERYEEEVER